MDFLDDIGETLNVRYEETGETGDAVLMLQDIDSNTEDRFYPEDIKKILNLLDRIKNHPTENTDVISLNESFNIWYDIIDGEGVIILEDLDNDDNDRWIYPEEIQKLGKFLNRLKTFGVIKV